MDIRPPWELRHEKMNALPALMYRAVSRIGKSKAIFGRLAILTRMRIATSFLLANSAANRNADLQSMVEPLMSHKDGILFPSEIKMCKKRDRLKLIE